MEKHGLDRFGPGHRQLAGAGECHNEPSDSNICGEFLDQLKTCQILKKDTVPWSCLVSYYNVYTIQIINLGERSYGGTTGFYE